MYKCATVFNAVHSSLNPFTLRENGVVLRKRGSKSWMKSSGVFIQMKAGPIVRRYGLIQTLRIVKNVT